MNTNISLLFVKILTLTLLLSVTSVACFSSEKSDSKRSLNKATIIWVGKKKAAFELFFSFFENGKWNKSRQLTFSDSINYLPTITNDKKGNTWGVWSALTKSGIQLHFAVIRNGIMIQEPKIIETGLSSNVGPYLEIDTNGKPLLVWAGNKGEDDDIYFSSWNDTKWDKPLRLHPKNEIPDYLPKIFIDQKGGGSVEWSTIGPEGQFIMERSLRSPIVKRNSVSIKNKIARQKNKEIIDNCLDVLPSEIQNIELSSIVLSCEGYTSPRQVRYLGNYIGITR